MMKPLFSTSIRSLILILVLGGLTNHVFGQEVEIELNNPSFEDAPHKGGMGYNLGVRGWYDCGRLTFPNETPPDVHPVNAWEVTKSASEGRTYLGMVVRDVDSWESLSQRLSQPIEGGKCYTFSIDLARSERYISGSRNTQRAENYNQPAVLRIWGGTGICGKQELLGESVTVSNNDWRTYEFEFRPERTVSYFTLEAFYKVPTLIPYNGHLLLDNASTIKEIPCDETEEPATEAAIVSNQPKKDRPKSPAKTAPAPVSEPLVADVSVQESVSEEKAPEKQRTLIPELQGDSFIKNQVIRLNTISFEEDKANISDESAEVLDQVYEFMLRNKGIVIEVGGHTSTGPQSSYCDRLSSKRAKAVATYIARKGISKKRLYFMGYGKRKPIIPNDRNNKEAKKKNQRVELKILKTDFTG